jgi:hypothetical protein
LAIGTVPLRFAADTTVEATFTKSVPLKATTHFSDVAIVTPVCPVALNVTVYVADVLLTTYILLAAGAVMVIAAEAGDAMIIAY